MQQKLCLAKNIIGGNRSNKDNTKNIVTEDEQGK